MPQMVRPFLHVVLASVLAASCLTGAARARASASASAASPPPPPLRPPDDPFAWSRSDLRQIGALERRVRQDGDLFTVQSDAYRVETEVSARFTAECAYFMDLLYATLRNIIRKPIIVEDRPTVCVFRDPDGYAQVIAGSSRGQFRYHWEGEPPRFSEFHLYTFIEEPREREFVQFYTPILCHEGTHQVLQQVAGTRELPPWIDEGLATFFQFWDVRRSTEENLESRYSRSHYRDVLARRIGRPGFPSAAALFAIPEDEWAPDDFGPVTELHYAAAESLIAYLISSRSGRESLARMLDLALAGEDVAAAIGADGMERLDRGWQDFVRAVVRG